MPEYPTKGAYYGADRSVRSSTSPQPTKSNGQHYVPHASSPTTDMTESKTNIVDDVGDKSQEKTHDTQDKTDDKSFVVVNMDEGAHDDATTGRNSEMDGSGYVEGEDIDLRAANDKVPDKGALESAERIKARGARISVVHGVFH